MFFCSDADAAGAKASLRSIEILLKQNFEVKIATLPKGEDPDSFINQNGKEAFEEQILKAQNFLEYQTAQYQEAGMFEDAVKQAEAIRELVKSAALVVDELKRNLLIKTIAKKFGLREKLIESELIKYLNQQKQQVSRKKISGQEKHHPNKLLNQKRAHRKEI
ncbi:MAG: toprim domain-containing protein [Melioribacteraceae bacterium]|nr:toprim domain-containing protein [Melioribacteraceae bacterium]